MAAELAAGPGETHGPVSAKSGRKCRHQGFCQRVLLYREHPAEAIQAVVELALENHLSSSQGVKHLLLQGQARPEFTSLKQWPATMLADLSVYGQLGVVP